MTLPPWGAFPGTAANLVGARYVPEGTVGERKIGQILLRVLARAASGQNVMVRIQVLMANTWYLFTTRWAIRAGRGSCRRRLFFLAFFLFVMMTTTTALLRLVLLVHMHQELGC